MSLLVFVKTKCDWSPPAAESFSSERRLLVSVVPQPPVLPEKGRCKKCGCLCLPIKYELPYAIGEAAEQLLVDDLNEAAVDEHQAVD